MAIAPLNITPMTAYSAVDFSPLARLGQTLQPQDNGLADLARRYGVSPSSLPSSPSSLSSSSSGDYGSAISNIESGGRYDLLGPVTRTGDRAYGKYQIMGSNIPEWTRAALGREMSPQEFLADQKAQDAVFAQRFGQYVEKYGPGGAARAWFAGEGGMNNPNATDQLGTSVADYERRFNAGLR
jgi:hypothetical protein